MDQISMRIGTILDMPANEYFADPCPKPSLTQSIAKILIDQSPAHARLVHPKLNGLGYKPELGEYKSATAIGNAAHKLVLGRGKDIAVLEFKDFRTDAAKAARDETIASGGVPILVKHHNVAKALAAAIREQLDLAGCGAAFEIGNPEVVMIAERDGTYFRSMVDWMVSPTLFYDLKTLSSSAAPYTAPSRMVDHGWDVQAAMQEHILDILDGTGDIYTHPGRRKFRFVAVETEEPFALTVNELDENTMTMGRKKLHHAIRIWRECMKNGHWPGYPPIVNRPEYPNFAVNQWLNREIAEQEKFNPEVVLAG
jgi:PDDEXK-like domain of unknown function (DUF3799)